MEQRDSVRRVGREHIVNGDKDCLDRIDPLKFTKEVDV